MKNKNIVPLSMTHLEKWLMPIDKVMRYRRPFYSMSHVIGIDISTFMSIKNHVIETFKPIFEMGIMPLDSQMLVYNNIIIAYLFINENKQPRCLRCGMEGITLTAMSKHGFIPCVPKTDRALISQNCFVFEGPITKINENCAYGLQMNFKLKEILKIHNRYNGAKIL